MLVVEPVVVSAVGGAAVLVVEWVVVLDAQWVVHWVVDLVAVSVGDSASVLVVD